MTSRLSYRGGGVATAVRTLVRRQQAQGMEVAVAGLGDAAFESEREAWRDVPVTACGVRGPGIFGYAPELGRALSRSDAELVHLHGLWTYPHLAVTRWQAETGRPVCLSTHGMLAPRALVKSAWRKINQWWQRPHSLS